MLGRRRYSQTRVVLDTRIRSFYSAWRADVGFPSTQSCGDLFPLCQSSPIIHGTLRSITSQPVRRVPSAPSSSQGSLGDSGQASTGLRLQEEGNGTGSALSPPSLPARGTVTASPSLHQCAHRCRLMPCGRALPAPPAPRSLQKKPGSGSSPLARAGVLAVQTRWARGVFARSVSRRAAAGFLCFFLTA